MFDATVASDEQMIGLYSEVTKEPTNRWKRAMKYGSWLISMRNKEKKILQECSLLSKEKLRLEKLTEGIDPFTTIKMLVEAVIEKGANNQLEIQHLKWTNKEIRKLHSQTFWNNQDVMAQQTSTIIQSEYEKFKEVQQQLEVVTSQETTLNTILNNWPSYFSTTYNKQKAQKYVIFDLRTTRLLTTDQKSKVAISNHIAKEKEVKEELSK